MHNALPSLSIVPSKISSRAILLSPQSSEKRIGCVISLEPTTALQSSCPNRIVSLDLLHAEDGSCSLFVSRFLISDLG